MKHLLSILLIFGYIAISQTPKTLNYQGYLQDSSGDPVNGSENITFRIYDASTGGSALWTEVRTVTLNDGVFSVVLGENTPINLPFDTQYWLGITVGGSELSPRTKLASSAYASNLPKVAFVKDVKANGTQGGTFTAGAWRTRELNTIEGDNSFISLSSNQIILDPGSYVIEATVPAWAIDDHKARLYNVTDGVAVVYASSEECSTEITSSKINTVVTIASQTTFIIQHRSTDTRATNGFGRAVNLGGDEVYTQVKITKIAN